MIIDIIIIITILASIIIGRIRGFMKCLIGIVSIALSVILALLFYRAVGDIVINNTDLDEKIKNSIVSNFGINDVEINLNNKLPEAYSKYVEKANGEINDTKNGIQDSLALKIANEIIYAMSYIIILILIKIVTIILTILSKFVDKLPVFKQINDIGGAICGFIQGIIIVYIIISVISVISPLINNQTLINQMEESYIGKYIYDNNILIKAIF